MSALINAGMIIVGLRPLNKIKNALHAVRTGKASHIHIALPLEIQPMAREMNALIDNQLYMVERFRTQLGNLAHAMKTPLAILINEAEKADNLPQNALILEQALIMRGQIQHHLQRAQMAAGRGSLLVRTNIKPLLDRLIRVMGKLFPDKAIDIDITDKDLIFAGNAQDMEEIIGNLLENAGKWAKNCIHITVDIVKDPASFTLIVEDDGVGLEKEEMAQALQRGHRLDENVSGSGLGLSIVVDMVRDYGGSFTLDTSPLGGLRACLHLPRATS